jgi:hypothetical protein
LARGMTKIHDFHPGSPLSATAVDQS